MAVIEAQPPAPVWEHALRQFGARLFEAAPGLVTWVLLLAPAWIPIIFHSSGALFVAVVVLIFDTYWVLRAVGVVTGVYGTMLRMRRDMKKDWLAMCRQQPPAGDVDPLQYFHLSVVPTYTEPYHVLERTVQAIVDANYPDELKLVGIITRETDKPGWENVARLKEKFGHRLSGFYHIKDPLEPGIVVGKSAAMNWGGRWMVRVLTEAGYDLSRVLLTDLDSDYRVHEQYFAWISWHHAREPMRDYLIWQPVPLFHNNIWQVPLAVRIMSASTSQWQMFLHSRPHRLVAFSSYTCSLDFVHKVGYWDKDVIPEDSRFYWKAFFTFGKRFAVKSVWLPIYGDSPGARLCGDPRQPVQPDQAVGLGYHRRPLCAGPVVQPSRDPAVAASKALPESLPQSPQLDLSARAAALRRVGADLGQHRLLADGPRTEPLGNLRRPAGRHPFHSALLSLLRDPDAPAEAGGVASVEEGRDLPRILPLPDGGSGPQRASGARGPHAITVGTVPRIPRYGEGMSRHG